MAACQPTLNNPTTEQNVPEQKWSCFECVHKFVLIAFVLFKMALNFWLLLLLLMGLNMETDVPKAVFCFVLLRIATFINVFDIVMGLVIIISVCFKCQRIMKIYYIYSIYIFGLLTVLCCITMYMINPTMRAMLYLLLQLMWILLLQIFLNHMVKEEVKKLNSSVQIQV